MYVFTRDRRLDERRAYACTSVCAGREYTSRSIIFRDVVVSRPPKRATNVRERATFSRSRWFPAWPAHTFNRVSDVKLTVDDTFALVRYSPLATQRSSPHSIVRVHKRFRFFFASRAATERRRRRPRNCVCNSHEYLTETDILKFKRIRLTLSISAVSPCYRIRTTWGNALYMYRGREKKK